MLPKLKKVLADLSTIVEAMEREQQPDLFAPVETVKVPLAQIVQNYNLTCISLPKCSQLSEARKIHLRQRWNEAKPTDCFLAFFARVEASDFLTGRTASGFRASFDWLFNAANFVKINEGNYDNRPNGAAKHRAATEDEHARGF